MSTLDVPAAKRQKTVDETVEAGSDALVKSSPETATEPGLVERDVGIEQFVSSGKGFKGCLKQRYSDFQVNEIGLDGKTIRLINVPQPAKRQPKEVDAESKEAPVKQEVPDISEHQAELEQIFGAEGVAKILGLFQSGSKIVLDREISDKTERTRAHQLLAAAFKQRLETSTLKSNQFEVRLATQQTRSRDSRKARPAGAGGNSGARQPFVHFTLCKENKETLEAASLIAKLLRLQPRAIAFAGTKDRRGVTTQRFSAQRVDLDRIGSLNGALKQIKVGDAVYARDQLRLGDLSGNEFLIAIRDAKNLDGSALSRADVDLALEPLRQNGFINYFGLQRFGTFSVSTHTLGKLILRGDFDEAVNLILSPQKLALPESQEARKIWAETKNAAAALKAMPHKCLAEHSLLTALCDSPSGINAILRIPRNLRLMYVHAYQSYVWNCAASERLKRFGPEVVEGDLVDDGMEGAFRRARAVTAEDVSLKKFNITDILLPTPGFDVLYPPNLVDFYEQLMNVGDGIDCHKMRRNTREFSLSGDYRAVMAKPTMVEWFTVEYSEENEQILRTDMEKIVPKSDTLPTGHELEANAQDSGSQNGTEPNLKTEQSPAQSKEAPNPELPWLCLPLCDTQAQKEKKFAVIVRMQLQQSQYATMALREVMKVDTGRQGGLFF